MPRLKKRTIASRQSATQAALKRRRTSSGEQEISDGAPLEEFSSIPEELGSEFQVDGLGSDATGNDESESDAESEGLLSEEEDKFPIGQPAAGWEKAEMGLSGYSKTRVYQQKISYHKNKEEIKRRREEKLALKAGISVTQRTKPIWGDISKMFASTHPASAQPPPPPPQDTPRPTTPPPPTKRKRNPGVGATPRKPPKKPRETSPPSPTPTRVPPTPDQGRAEVTERSKGGKSKGKSGESVQAPGRGSGGRQGPTWAQVARGGGVHVTVYVGSGSPTPNKARPPKRRKGKDKERKASGSGLGKRNGKEASRV